MTFETSKRIDNWCKRHQENGCVCHMQQPVNSLYINSCQVVL